MPPSPPTPPQTRRTRLLWHERSPSRRFPWPRESFKVVSAALTGAVSRRVNSFARTRTFKDMVTLRECTCRRGWTPSPDWPGYNRRGLYCTLVSTVDFFARSTFRFKSLRFSHILITICGVLCPHDLIQFFFFFFVHLVPALKRSCLLFFRAGSQALFFFFPFLLPSEIFVGAVQRVAQPGVGRSRVF